MQFTPPAARRATAGAIFVSELLVTYTRVPRAKRSFNAGSMTQPPMPVMRNASARRTGFNRCGPIFCYQHTKIQYDERTHVPPGCDAGDWPGSHMYFIEVRRCRAPVIRCSRWRCQWVGFPRLRDRATVVDTDPPGWSPLEASSMRKRRPNL